MIDDIDKYVDILCKLDITEHQFLILWLVFHKDETNIAKYKSYKNFSISEIEDLISKGYLDDFGIIKDGERNFNIYDFIVTEQFSSVVVIDKFDAIEELLSVYPGWFFFSGKKIPAKSFDDRFGDIYFKIIKGNRIKHDKIIKITKEYHEKFTDGYAQKKFEDYLNGKMWILYEQALNDETRGDITNQVY